MTPLEYIEFVMNIQDERELLDQRNYKKIRNAIGTILESSDRYESMDEAFDQLDSLTNGIFSEIDEALMYHVGNDHTVSTLLRSQLEELERNNCVLINGKFYPYTIRLIYWTMEKVVKEDPSIEVKSFDKGDLLTGRDLYHVHHNQTNSIGKNAKRYLDAHYKTFESFQELILECKKGRKEATVRELLHDFTYSMLMDSLGTGKQNDDWNMTGEWLVFQKLKSGSVNFLCLATHEEGKGTGQALFNKIQNHLLV